MTATSAKAIASLIAAVMSFLGWSASDYAQYLPREIRSQIVLNLPQVETASTSPKSSAVILQVKPPAPKPEIPAFTTPKPKAKAPVPAQIPKPISTPPVQPPMAPTTVAPLPPAETPIENLSQEERIKRSTVNILCSMQKGNLIQKFTGSGVVIDPSGIIITNAHVAEHVMLAQAGYESCNIRTGSPAKNSYKAKVIYLPDIWIANNKSNLSMQTITGTGENDYALLIITERTARDAPNVPLPYLLPSDKSLAQGEQIILAGYPASFGDAALLDSALYLLQKSSQITNVFGFSASGSDIVSTSPTPVAEHGSSGGAVAGEGGVLLGIMVATSIDSYTGGKNIQAITLSYIKRSIQINSGKSFEYFLGNAQSEANNFEQNKAASLSAILMQGL